MSLTPVLLGLGSNAQRDHHLHAGLDALAELLEDMRCSPVFESLAVGYKGDNFYNLVVAGHTDLPLTELDRRLKFIEADNGRYAPDRKGLPLDIDVLLYDELVGNFHGLLLPRAEILKNAFVLWPLALLAPALKHPAVGECFADLWAHSSIDQQLWPVSFQWRGMELTPAELIGQHPPRSA
ncbi:2-amino-4-hydroxy-6-hydroxymethyldihydropteridine diphosphokinase [Pseudomonas songnenensis]|uniref:2-amino-4-hydroxy-6-hydroxymethyldihydropteridine diphosphokinase n=1 Tax=Pseudomonas songnenensis TaxID=1176259 RepID=A0A482UHC3_9PSED|nr:2-amino-4-hydroxy-6-hydroxymethyldihydropteridine diphosphokinase [Pseudomonas songnenensis]RYJ62590.1 2-amino-4-hydroxy-6-hydroxymethyldihydropteridine diphosphokinase [Pseudomonas songnenensis]